MSALDGWTCSACGKDTEPCACPDPQREALEACVARLCEVSNYIGPFGEHRWMFEKLTETINVAKEVLGKRPPPSDAIVSGAETYEQRARTAMVTIKATGHRCVDRVEEDGE